MQVKEKLKLWVSSLRTWGGRLLDVMTLPFTQELRYFLTMLILMMSASFFHAAQDCIAGASLSDSIVYEAKMMLDCMVECWMAALIYAFLKLLGKWPAMLWAWVTVGFNLLLAVLDIVCYTILDSYFCNDFIMLIKSSDVNESSEFFSFYFNTSVWIALLMQVAVLAAMLYVVKRYGRRLEHTGSRIFNRLFGPAMLLLVIAGYCYQKYLAAHDEGQLVEMYRRFDLVKAAFYKVKPLENPTPSVVRASGGQPQHIVVIIGESLAPYHMSLYGYDKCTNPCLQRLVNDSLLVVFPNVTSPATNTNESISLMLTSALADGKDYTESYTMPVVAKAAGYVTEWYSMNNEKGYFDGVVSGFARLCDNVKFLMATIEAANTTDDYDERLLPLVRSLSAKDSTVRYMTVLHLRGQHPDFKKRYPLTWKKFDASEYAGRYEDEHQCKVVSFYDNSVAYNDSVVAEMMRAFDDTETIVLYMSDHSLDIYRTGYYCGHAKKDDPQSVAIGREIPLMVYMTPKLRAKYPQTVERVNDAVGRRYDTGYLLYTLMDLMGVEFDGKHDVPRYSLFAPE